MSKTFDQIQNEIARLCQYFANNQQSFLAPDVKESHVRQLLIDPFFETLLNNQLEATQRTAHLTHALLARRDNS